MDFTQPSVGIFAKGGGGGGGNDGPSGPGMGGGGNFGGTDFGGATDNSGGGLGHETPAAQTAQRASTAQNMARDAGKDNSTNTTTSVLGGLNAAQQALGLTNPADTTVDPDEGDIGTDWGQVAKATSIGSVFGMPGMVMGGLLGYAMQQDLSNSSLDVNAESFREAEADYANARGRQPGYESSSTVDRNGRGGGEGGREEGLTKAQKAPADTATPITPAPTTAAPTDLNPFDSLGSWWDDRLRKEANKNVGLRQMRTDSRYSGLMSTFVPMAQ